MSEPMSESEHDAYRRGMQDALLSPGAAGREAKTLRDEFAMAAMAGLLANGEYEHLEETISKSHPCDVDPHGVVRAGETVAWMSYGYADMMLAERNKTVQPTDPANPLWGPNDTEGE